MHRTVAALSTCFLACAAISACELDTVEYGDPGGLRLVPNDITNCELPSGATGTPCPTWEDVYAIFDSSTYGCTLSSCHGADTQAAGLFMPQGDAATGYTNMTAFEARDGSLKLYIAPGDETSYLLCNLNPDPAQTIGTLMPIGGFQKILGDDLLTIGNWYACGQSGPGMGSGPSGSGGMGAGGMGSGGMGGAGGM